MMKIIKILILLGLLATIVVSCGQPSDYDSTKATTASTNH
jgi:hypothetical protein